MPNNICENCQLDNGRYNFKNDCCLIRYISRTPPERMAAMWDWLASSMEDVEDLKEKVKTEIELKKAKK